MTIFTNINRVIEWLESEGVTEVGDKIPSERHFKDKGMSRSYIREAMSVFEYHGWVVCYHGKGRVLTKELDSIKFLVDKDKDITRITIEHWSDM